MRWNRKALCFAAMLMGLPLWLVSTAHGQPVFTTVRDWTVETPAGRFGYEEIRQYPGGFLQPCLWLGPSGRVLVAPGVVIAGLVIFCTLVALCIVSAVCQLRRRTAHRNQTEHLP